MRIEGTTSDFLGCEAGYAPAESGMFMESTSDIERWIPYYLQRVCEAETVTCSVKLSLLTFLTHFLPENARERCWSLNINLIFEWLQKGWIDDGAWGNEINGGQDLPERLREELVFWRFIASRGWEAEKGFEFITRRCLSLLDTDFCSFDPYLLKEMIEVIVAPVEINSVSRINKLLFSKVICISIYAMNSVDWESFVQEIAHLIKIDSTWEFWIVKAMRMVCLEMNPSSTSEGEVLLAIVRAFAVFISNTEEGTNLKIIEQRLSVRVAPIFPFIPKLENLFGSVFEIPLRKEERGDLDPELREALQNLLKRANVPLKSLVRLFRLLLGRYKLDFPLSRDLITTIVKKGFDVSEITFKEYCESMELLTSPDLDIEFDTLSRLDIIRVQMFLMKPFYFENVVIWYEQGALWEEMHRVNCCIKSAILRYDLNERATVRILYRNWKSAFKDALSSVRNLKARNTEKQKDLYGRKRHKPSLYDIHMHSKKRLPLRGLVAEINDLISYCRVKSKKNELLVCDLDRN